MQSNCAIFGWILVMAGLLLFLANARPAGPIGLLVAAILVYGLVCHEDKPKSVTHGLK